MVYLVISSDESDEPSDGFELDKSLKAGTFDSFTRGLQGKGSNRMARPPEGSNLTEKRKVAKEHVRKYEIVSAGPNTKYAICKKGWLKLYSGKESAEFAICTLCVKQ